MVSRLFALAIVCLASASTAYAAGPVRPFKVGNWQAGSYTNDADGGFSHCAAFTPYRSGITFFVSVTRDYQWSLGFAHPSWRLTNGQTIPIELTFDGGSKFNVVGTAFRQDFVLVPMPTTSQLISRFRAATEMTALANGNVFQFALTTTSRLLPTLVECVKQETGAVTAARPAAPPSAPVSSLNPTNAELHYEAVGLATNFILNSGLERPKVLARTETPVELIANGAAWKSSDAVGAVRIITPLPNQKGIDVAAAVAAADAKECKGKFASGRTSELVDDEVVFRGFSTCEDSAGARIAQYFIVPRKRGGFALFSVASAVSSEKASTAVGEDRLTNYRKAALTAASD